MKTINYFLTAIIVAFLFSSCGSLSISQKRYSRGLNIDWFSKKDDKPVAAKTRKSKQAEVTAVAAKEETPEVEVAEDIQAFPESAAINEVILASPAYNSGIEKNSYSRPAKKNREARKSFQNGGTGEQGKEMLKQASSYMPATVPDGTDDGVATLLLVILCIIPPLGLLAVFLHQGEINEKFWISLLLHLLFILPGIIYSLLVVLDVV